MNNCLKNIISANVGCGEVVESLSGYDILDAPEISTNNLASITNEDQITVKKLLDEKIRLATLDVTNDFLGLLNSNKIMANLLNQSYDVANYTVSVIPPASTLERGFDFYKAKAVRSNIRKTRITSLSLYALGDGDTTIKIYDGNTVASFPITAVNGNVSTIKVDYIVKSDMIRVVTDNSVIPVGSSLLTCMVGCNGTKPNTCGYTKSWNGSAEVSGKEGYGLNMTFECFCDYEMTVCTFARNYIGKIIWLKTRLLIAEEARYTNRFNNWTVYGQEESKEIINTLKGDYVEEWNTFVSSLPNMINKLQDGCYECKGSKWVQNI